MKTRLVYGAAGCLALGLLLWVACGERIAGDKEGVQEVGEVLGGGKVSGTLVVPDSVPVVVDEAALARAFELRCSGIRILRLVKPDERADEESYYVTFFEDGCGKAGWDVKEHRLVVYHKAIGQVRVGSMPEIADDGLRKSAQYLCFSLAEVFKDAYHSGDSFCFSQATQGAGYFHKVIWNLANSQSCCLYNYPGGFNDCISSHRWPSDETYYPYRTVPHKLQVWKHANRQGPSHTFKDGHQLLDDNWQGEIWWDNGVPESINDKVSSLDMMYWVTAS